MVKELTIKNRDQLHRISRLACDAPYEIYLHAGPVSGNVRELTPADLYGLVGEKVCMVAEDNADPIHFGCLVEEMSGESKVRRTLRQRMSDMMDRMEPHYGWEMRMKRIQC